MHFSLATCEAIAAFLGFSAFMLQATKVSIKLNKYKCVSENKHHSCLLSVQYGWVWFRILVQ